VVCHRLRFHKSNETLQKSSMDQCRLTKEDKGNDELTLGKNSIDLLGLTKEDKDGDDFLCRVSNIVQERQENYNIF
jgi:hypothetical protein